MLAALRRRAVKAALLERIEPRLARGDGMGIDDLEGRVDFVLAFAACLWPAARALKVPVAVN